MFAQKIDHPALKGSQAIPDVDKSPQVQRVLDELAKANAADAFLVALVQRVRRGPTQKAAAVA